MNYFLKGSSHRLEINKSAAAADGTELRMSDLSSKTGSDVIRVSLCIFE